MKLVANKPCTLSGKRYFIGEEIPAEAVLCKEIVFDILEYPAQETTDPDPVMALNRYIKKLFPECIVFGIDELSEYTIPADTPVFYSGLKSIDSTDGHSALSVP